MWSGNSIHSLPPPSRATNAVCIGPTCHKHTVKHVCANARLTGQMQSTVLVQRHCQVIQSHAGQSFWVRGKAGGGWRDSGTGWKGILGKASIRPDPNNCTCAAWPWSRSWQGTRVCTCSKASTDPRSLIGLVGAYPGARGDNLLSPLLFHAVQS